MTHILKILFLFKKPARRLNDFGYFILGVLRIISIGLTFFICCVLGGFIFTHIPALSVYAERLNFTGVTGYLSSLFIAGFFALLWLALWCLCLFTGGSVLFMICQIIGGKSRDE